MAGQPGDAEVLPEAGGEVRPADLQQVGVGAVLVAAGSKKRTLDWTLCAPLIGRKMEAQIGFARRSAVRESFLARDFNSERVAQASFSNFRRKFLRGDENAPSCFPLRSSVRLPRGLSDIRSLNGTHILKPFCVVKSPSSFPYFD